MSSSSWARRSDTQKLERWLVEMLLYVHRNHRLIRDGSPGQPPRLSHSSRLERPLVDIKVGTSQGQGYISRQDQEEGGELDSHEEVRLSFNAGPGEINRRD